MHSWYRSYKRFCIVSYWKYKKVCSCWCGNRQIDSHTDLQVLYPYSACTKGLIIIILSIEMIEGSLIDNWNTRNLSCRRFDPMLESSSRRDEARLVGLSIGSPRDRSPPKLIDSSPCACLIVRPARLCGCGGRCSGCPHPSIFCTWRSSSRVAHIRCLGLSASLRGYHLAFEIEKNQQLFMWGITWGLLWFQSYCHDQSRYNSS